MTYGKTNMLQVIEAVKTAKADISISAFFIMTALVTASAVTIAGVACF
jgi:hypothetical protein